MRLHFSIGSDDYRRTARFRQSIHFSITQVLLLIMCIDAPESTTNSRSSGLGVDADRHLFSEGEKNVALSCSFNLKTLLASFHAALALATLSPPETDPKILERWGCAGEVHLGKSIRAKDFGLEFECDVQ